MAEYFSRHPDHAILFAFACFALASFGLLTLSLRTLEVGPAYAVWTGIGAAGTAIVGMLLLGESREVLRICCIGLIVAGVVGLKFAATEGR